MEKYTLKAAKRTVSGRKVKNLRKSGIIPANIYGKKIKSESVQIDEKEFRTVFSKAGETGLIELLLEGEKRPVLVHNLQHHAVLGSILHADFYQVDLKEKVTAKVPLVLTGEAPAVKDKAGVILTLINEVEVEALPSDLIDKIEVDVAGLSKVGDGLKIGDLKVSGKIKILNDEALEVVKVAPLVSKEAEKMAAEEAAAAAAAAATSAASTTEGASEAPAAVTPVATTSPSPKTEEPKV